MLHEFCFGNLNPSERHPRNLNGEHALVKKSSDAEASFASKLSADERERFQAVLALYAELSVMETSDSFSYGYALGTLIMMDVLREAEAIKMA